jgi:uncharacterized protein YjbI with pentapeptide repeats
MRNAKKALHRLEKLVQTPFAIVIAGSLIFPSLLYFTQLSISEQARKDSIVQAYLESAREFLLHLADSPKDTRIAAEGMAISARAAIMQLASGNGRLNEYPNVARINLIISHLVSSRVLSLRSDDDKSAAADRMSSRHDVVPVEMFNGLNLSRVNLGELDLAGFNLSQTDLRYSNLRRSILTDANLRNAALGHADLGGSHANRADFRGADMDDVNLSMSRLDRAEFGADPDAILNDNQSIAPTTRLNRANMIGSSLVRARIGSSQMQAAKLASANLIGADMRGADLRGSDLMNAIIDKTTRFDNALTDEVVFRFVRK